MLMKNNIVSVQEAEVGGSWIWDQPGLYREFEPSLGSINSNKDNNKNEQLHSYWV